MATWKPSKQTTPAWVAPAVANDINTVVEPARALVVLMANETIPLESEDH